MSPAIRFPKPPSPPAEQAQSPGAKGDPEPLGEASGPGGLTQLSTSEQNRAGGTGESQHIPTPPWVSSLLSHSGTCCSPCSVFPSQGRAKRCCLPRLAPAWRPALIPFSKAQRSLLRIMTMVLNLPPYIHHWYLPFKHFSLNTFSTYQLK